MKFLKSTPVPVVIRAYHTIHLALEANCRMGQSGWEGRTVCGRPFPQLGILISREMPRSSICETCMHSLISSVGLEMMATHIELEPGETWLKESVAE